MGVEKGDLELVGRVLGPLMLALAPRETGRDDWSWCPLCWANSGCTVCWGGDKGKGGCWLPPRAMG